MEKLEKFEKAGKEEINDEDESMEKAYSISAYYYEDLQTLM